MEVIRAFGEATFASLKVRNYRLYLLGVSLSNIGDWMLVVALGWLVLELTGSGTALGVVLGLRFAPLLFLGLFVGDIVDRSSKRRLLLITQSSFGLLAAVLGVLVFTGHIELWMVYLLALLLGVVDVFDRPARQTFIHETVGPENLRNAVSLNSSVVNLARAVGPLLAGMLIAFMGIAMSFFLKTLSVFAILFLLFRMDVKEVHREVHEDVDFLSGVRYALSVPLIRTILLCMAVMGTLAYEFQTSLPLLARTTFLGDASDYAALLSAMGAGSVVGGLFSAGRKIIGAHEFVLWAFLFGVSICVAALSPTLGLTVVLMGFVGFFSICLSSTGNTMIQLESAAHIRGRVMSLWFMAIFGSTLIGGPIIGFIGEHISPRAALAVGGLAALAAAMYANRVLVTGYRLLTIPGFISVRREEAIDDANT